MLTNTVLAVVAVLAQMHSAMAADSLYEKGSPILQITNKKQLNELINTSNHTSIVEFYAPWCGHCKNLKGDYEKAARSLAGMVNVAAVNCDETRELCSSMGVQGFPTLKIVRPSKTPGRKPVIEDYQGQRTAGSIVDSLTSQMNNHVVKVTDATLDAFLAANEGPKALLFTEKGTTAPTTKALATDFLGALSLGQVRSKEKVTVDKYGVTKFPALVLLPAGDDGKEPVVYDGKMKLKEMAAFLSQAAEPNKPVDINVAAPPKKAKADKEKKDKAEKKAEKKEGKADEEETATSSTPTEQQTAPVIVQSAIPIPTVHTPEKLQSSCLGEKSHTCVLAFISDNEANNNDKATQDVLDHLAELAHKNAQAKRATFPFYVVPASNEASALLLKALGLEEKTDQVHLVAVNARRGWWRHFEGDDLSFKTIESWFDAIRMGEGAKEKLPASLVVKAEVKEEPKEEAKTEAKEEEVKHEEL
ncbi:hypothetical protein SCUCBS95973_007731 [Sporothrix curviconia]|uniref:protein disulfide-isomerase n=1 Tax=Sporothrix curviconia TaxID=1260050 RepID=A0ABP0CI86_9PEZI